MSKSIIEQRIDLELTKRNVTSIKEVDEDGYDEAKNALVLEMRDIKLTKEH